jgi:uncharacterized membrane protein YvbJ
MALINCGECGDEVSDKAPTCPKCGVPIATMKEAQAAGTQINTVQEISKKFKLQAMLSGFCIIVGFVWLTAAPTAEEKSIPGILIFVGLVWYLVNRFRIWWHHR